MLFAASALVALVPFVAAQTFTACDPTKKTCPADPGFSDATTVYNFQQSAPGDDWKVLGGADQISQDGNGLHFTIDKEGEAPTLTTLRYLFFGKVTATLQAAPGAGIVSAFILQSDDLDEIDWEWLGGDTSHVQSNYFSKGDTSSYDRGGIHNVDNPQTTFHTYEIDWSADKVDWIIDGAIVRTLTAASVGAKFPQTPCQVRIGTWCGGCSGEPNGTVQWSGGPTTFDGAPYVMTITSLQIDNANPAGSYSYGDMTGNAASIVDGGEVDLGNNSTDISSASESASASASAGSASESASASQGAGSETETGSNSASPTGGSTGFSNAQTTQNAGPTSNNLPPNSSGTKVTLGGLVALVFGAIVLLA